MKARTVFISIIGLLSLSGCSALSSFASSEGESAPLNSTIKRCTHQLSNKQTYWSRFEAGSIYLYDRTGKRCLLRVLVNREKSGGQVGSNYTQV